MQVVVSGLLELEGRQQKLEVRVVLPPSYPHNAPVLTVAPLPGYHLVQTRNVTTSGKVFLHYLAEWAHPAGNLVDLITVLLAMLVQECPLRPGHPPPRPTSLQPATPTAPDQLDPGHIREKVSEVMELEDLKLLLASLTLDKTRLDEESTTKANININLNSL